ncbi:MAG: ABC transporter substrate-binding protein [Cyanobacteria bacterium J069]|nr:MAG: Tat pathway signal protein [Cyanobacteria bacterium J069]
MNSNWLGRFLSIALIASPLLLSSCQTPAPEATAPEAAPEATTAASPTAPTEMLTVKVNPSWLLQGDNAPITLAIEKGYFAAEGLDVVIERGYGSAKTITDVAAGAVDIGFGDMYSMIEFNAKNPNDPVVAVAVPYNRSPFAIAALNTSNIGDPKALQGKKLGAPAGDAPRKLWPVFAEQVGIPADSVEWVTMEPKLRETFLVKGDVDAVSGFSTSILPALTKAGKQDSDTTMFYYNDYGLDLYGNAIVVKKAFLEANPDLVRGFLRAYFKGMQDTIKDPAAGLASVMKAGDSLMDEASEKQRLQIALERLWITPEVESQGLGGVDPARFEETIAQVAEVFEVTPPPISEVFDDSYLPPVAERGLPLAGDRKPLQ